MKDVFNLVKSVWENDSTKIFVETTLEGTQLEERGKVNHEIEHLLASMSVICLDIKVAGNTLHPHFNIYTDCDQFSDDKIWTHLRSYLFTAAYVSTIQGRATTEKIPF